mgnify:CR=1 FL=1
MRAGGSCKKAYTLFSQVVTKNYRSVERLKIALRKRDTYGYILHEEDFIRDANHNLVNDVCVYLKLASLRNYAEYLEKGEDRLPVYFFDGDIEKLKRNPLLTIDDKFIYFKY